MRKITQKSFLKYALTLFYPLFIVFILTACATGDRFNLENHIGLYEVVESKCDVTEGSINPCEDTRFFELVKGQFMGVKDSELAYVFWSGNSAVDPELQYTSFPVAINDPVKLHDGKLWLNNKSESEEYLVFSGDKLVAYFSKYTVGGRDNVRIVKYLLKRVERGSLPNVRLNYPGNK